MVFAQQSLHHIDALEHAAEQIARTLLPGGVLVLNEYVGPTRFQLPTQLNAIDAALRDLPERFRIRASDGTVKEHQEPFDLAWFDANDPSEAIRSAEMVPVLRDRFTFTDAKPVARPR